MRSPFSIPRPPYFTSAAGFDPNSGGAPRYVPPAYRNVAGGRDSRGDHTKVGGHGTRSLTEVESFQSGGRRGRHLLAAFFLRAASTALPSSPNHEFKRSNSAERALSTAAMMGLACSAMRVAEKQLGCGDCRLIVSEDVPAEESTTISFSRSSEGDDGTRDWWAKLWQVEQRSEKQEERSWIGVELSLRWSDVYCSDGQAAIIGFLRSLVGLREEEEGGERESENGVKAGARQTAAILEDGTGKTPSSEDEEKKRTSGALDEITEDRGSDSVGVIADVVLVFGGELSKRDRAGLHSHAEKTEGVESSSHGVGDARFLALRCGLGGGSSTAVGLQLSREQVR